MSHTCLGPDEELLREILLNGHVLHTRKQFRILKKGIGASLRRANGINTRFEGPAFEEYVQGIFKLGLGQ